MVFAGAKDTGGWGLLGVVFVVVSNVVIVIVVVNVGWVSRPIRLYKYTWYVTRDHVTTFDGIDCISFH